MNLYYNHYITIVDLIMRNTALTVLLLLVTFVHHVDSGGGTLGTSDNTAVSAEHLNGVGDELTFAVIK